MSYYPEPDSHIRDKDHSMIETRRLKNVVIFFPNNFKFCAVKKNYKYFLFLVNISNDLLIPVPVVNTKVKEAPVIPAGIPTTEAYEAILTYQTMLTE